MLLFVFSEKHERYKSFSKIPVNVTVLFDWKFNHAVFFAFWLNYLSKSLIFVFLNIDVSHFSLKGKLTLQYFAKRS